MKINLKIFKMKVLSNNRLKTKYSLNLKILKRFEKILQLN